MRGFAKRPQRSPSFHPTVSARSSRWDVPDPQTDPLTVQYDVMGPYPYGTFYGGLDFVDYGIIPGCLENAERIPDKTLHASCLFEGRLVPLIPGKLNSSFQTRRRGAVPAHPPSKDSGKTRSGMQGETGGGRLGLRPQTRSITQAFLAPNGHGHSRGPASRRDHRFQLV